MCLLMADIEPLKPSNTGWLIANVVADSPAFGWARTAVDPRLLTLLADPQWQPAKRPLLVLLDVTWSEAGKMFRKSSYLNHLSGAQPAPRTDVQPPPAPLQPQRPLL